jgi:iron complex transport system substrate-binding protein
MRAVSHARLRARCIVVAAMVAAAAVWIAPARVGAQRSPARRIISLVPAVTEMLYAIGAGSDVLAVSSFDDYPPEVRALPRVGALLDPDTERILSMRPDLVVVYASQHGLKAQLQRTAVAVFDYRHGGLADITATMRRLGDATGHEADAARIVREIERRLGAVRERVAGRPRPRTLLVFGREALSLRNLYASGGQGFLHDVIEVGGGSNVFSDAKRESVQVSTEMLLARAPEVIVELRVGAAPPPEHVRRELDVWLRFTAVPAVKTRRTHILYGDHLVVPGPRVAQAAEEIARALHPDAFK